MGAFVRGAVGLVVRVDFDRVVCGVVFLVRLAVLLVPGFFLLAEVFLVLLVAVVRAIAILLTFHLCSNYSMRAFIAAID